MDATHLTSAYWQQQKERVQKSLARFEDRESLVKKGFAIPDEDDLRIGAGKRMKMAVLFLDICDSTTRSSERADGQSQMLKAMTLFFEEMIRIVEDYDGTVEKNTGDGLMAYFEDANGYQDSGCVRAIGAALTMQRANEFILGPEFKDLNLDPFQFRIGIDYGNITIAHVGRARGFHSIVAIGITANIASKILDVASAGEIVIGDWVRGQLPGEWENFIKPHTPETQFLQFRRGEASQPYPFFKFDARWELAI